LRDSARIEKTYFGDVEFRGPLEVGLSSAIVAKSGALRINGIVRAGATVSSLDLRSDFVSPLEFRPAIEVPAGRRLIVRIDNETARLEFNGGAKSLSGAGTLLNDATFRNGARIATGGAVGTLTVDGAVTMLSNSVFAAKIGGTLPGGHDQLVVTGTVALGGGILDVTTLPAYADPAMPGEVDSFALLEAGARDGAFHAVRYNGVLLAADIVDGESFRDHVDGGLFRGIAYSPTRVVLRNLRALPGDSDGDLDVDITDFNNLAAHFDPGGANPGNGWLKGNFDDDTDIDITDFNNFATNFAPGGYDRPVAAAVAKTDPGQIDLVVDLNTGEVLLDGNAAQASGIQVYSAGGSLIAQDLAPAILQFVISTNNTTYAEGAFANIGGNGLVSLGILYDLLSDERDLSFEYTMLGQPTGTGRVIYIPEPASMVLIAIGGLMMFQRQRMA